MKRTLFVVAAALALSAAACAPAPEPANNTNAASNANAAATPATTPVSDADIKAQEQKIWDAIKAKNWDGFAALLADDLLYVSENGVYDKAATVDIVKKIDLTELTLSDWKVTMIDKDAAVVAYTEKSKGSYDGRPSPDVPVRHSAAWVNRGGKWVNVYHQDCNAEVAQAQPSPATNTNTGTAANANANAAASPASSPSASPSGSPAAAPSTPTDTEKAIWDALKRKDWDGFASFLASEAMEVEPTGVYDKAGSVKGVQQANFSHVTLGDFREVKLDPDLALVTYVSKSPDKGWPPQGQRHTTIQVNRGGRWLAIHHHGTNIAKPQGT